MDLILKRLNKEEGYTEGELFRLDDGVPTKLCDTLEPQWRDLRNGEPKIPGETAIPEGRYPVLIYKSSRYMRNMPGLLEVPNFSGVLIHWGNSVHDTHGCILVGKAAKPGHLTNSRLYFDDLFEELQSAGLGITIQIV